MESVRNRSLERVESFSFSSCHQYDSTLADFSDDDEYDENDDESFIEITLEPTATYRNDDDDDDDDVEYCNQEMELRISFSSSVPYSELSTETKTLDSNSVTVSTSSSTTTTAFSLNSCSTETQWDPQVSSKPEQISTVNCFVNTFIPKSRVSSQLDNPSCRPADTNHLKLKNSSSWKPSNSNVTKTNSGIIMKFLIKFRAPKIRTWLASFVKPCEVNSSLDKRGHNGKVSEGTFGTYQRLIKPFNKWLVQRERGNSSTNLFGNKERSRVLEANLDAIRSVLETMSTSLGRKDRKTRSCPSSIKSSPFYQGFPSQSCDTSAEDNSIQSAIAHCKRSLGQV